MLIACLDLEGVLFPEIWINVAINTGVDELKLTTRDISDYDQLMQHRLKILKENNIRIHDIQDIINTLEPLPGAKDFYYQLRKRFQVIILSDTFYQFAMPFMKQLDYPALFCHNLVIDDHGFIKDYTLRIKDAKKLAVIKMKELNFKTIACGDSYNDISMLKEADKGILFGPPQNVIDEFPQFPVADDYELLWDLILDAKNQLLK
jgi:phosphoserine / homoserine phosphotransferase